jgi:hypothetical protein
MDLFGHEIRHIAGYLYDLGADAAAICPVKRAAARKNKSFLVFFHTEMDGFQRHRNPSVTDLAFYQLLRSGPAGKATTVEDRCPFPLRILSGHNVDMKYYNTCSNDHNGDSAIGVRSRLLEHTVRSWVDLDFTSGAHDCKFPFLAYTPTPYYLTVLESSTALK